MAVGDAEFQKKAIGKMQDVSRGEGRTVLFVSHNMGSIRSLCKRGLLLENGCVKADGEVNAILTFPVNCVIKYGIVTNNMYGSVILKKVTTAFAPSTRADS